MVRFVYTPEPKAERNVVPTAEQHAALPPRDSANCVPRRAWRLRDGFRRRPFALWLLLGHLIFHLPDSSVQTVLQARTLWGLLVVAWLGAFGPHSEMGPPRYVAPALAFGHWLLAALVVASPFEFAGLDWPHAALVKLDLVVSALYHLPRAWRLSMAAPRLAAAVRRRLVPMWIELHWRTERPGDAAVYWACFGAPVWAFWLRALPAFYPPAAAALAASLVLALATHRAWILA